MSRIRKLLLLAIAVCILPVLSVAAASAMASFNGCVLNEGDAHSCMVLGVDVGGALYAMFVSGWFAMLTLPVAATIALAWIVAEAVRVVRRRKSATTDVT